MSKIGVETDQHVMLNYKPAGVVERILAYIIDAFVLGAYYLVLTALSELGRSADVNPISPESAAVSVIIYIMPIFLYHLVIEVLWNGYSVGKWFMGIRVVKLDGTRPGLSSYFLRWLLRPFEISMTSGGVALMAILINGKGQRLGDMAGKTCVIKVRKNARLSDTMLKSVSEDYQPTYPQVVELSDEDISVINEVLKSRQKYDYATWLKMVSKTRNLIQAKMGITEARRTDQGFLDLVVQDYNALHGKVN